MLRGVAGRTANQLEHALATLLGAHWQVAAGHELMGRGALWRLAWRSGLRVLPFELRPQWPFDVPLTPSDPARRRLAPAILSALQPGLADAVPNTDEPFVRIFATLLLPTALPTLYLEGYRQARQAVLRGCPTPPPVIVSADWHFHEPFKFLAAEAAARGSRLVAVQHGGGYGLSRAAPLERHEALVSDAYVVWGWARDADPPPAGARHVDVPHPKLSRLLSMGRADRRPCEATAILMVGTGHYRYLYRFHSTPVGNQWEDYFGWAARFLGALPSGVRRAVTYRGYPARRFRDGARRRIASQAPEVRWDDGSRPLSACLGAARIVVIDHLSTTMLEALVANVPTVLFWDPGRWETRPSAQPLLDDLRRAGILWDAPEGAAAHVQTVYEDPRAWWQRAAVQEARQRFIERYALARADWASQWLEMFRRESPS